VPLLVLLLVQAARVSAARVTAPAETARVLRRFISGAFSFLDSRRGSAGTRAWRVPQPVAEQVKAMSVTKMGTPAITMYAKNLTCR
jgi:hypothetical protein